MDVVVGRVTKPHGLTGELSVEVRTDSPEFRFVVGSLMRVSVRGDTSRTLTIEAIRPHLERLLVRFAEVTTREEADALRGALLLGSTADLPSIEDPNEFYDHELEGLFAELIDGKRLGVVSEIIHAPGSELLVIQAEDGSQILVPFVKDIVPTVDVTEGRVIITPPEGLLDAN
jgi:16S rRNA processing protein RimM